MSKRSMVAAVLLGVAVVVVMSNGARADWVSAVLASTRVWPGDAAISPLTGLLFVRVHPSAYS